jgi:hypothetical protein
MASRTVLWMGSLVLPLFALLLMATVFGSGTMDSLPVGVVDHDATSASRRVIRRVDASPSLSVSACYTDEAEARAALRRMEIYGYVSIPSGFQQRLVAGHRPTVVYVFHYALLSVGSRVSAAFRTALAGDALPFLGETFPVYNTRLNYVVYLAYPFFFVLLQVLCLLVTLYAWGSGRPTCRAALPLLLRLAAVSMLAHAVLFGVMGIPSAGVWPTLRLWLLSVGLLLATQVLAWVIHRCSPDLSTAMSAGSMMGSLGATLCGVTFPLLAMDAPVRWASGVFPIRWFVEWAQQCLY